MLSWMEKQVLRSRLDNLSMQDRRELLEDFLNLLTGQEKQLLIQEIKHHLSVPIL